MRELTQHVRAAGRRRRALRGIPSGAVKFGILSSNIGSYSEPRTARPVAQAAERAGWDAYLIWDHLAFVWDKPAADPWVTLGAVAVSTERILIGTGVTPVARRRPQVVAHSWRRSTGVAPGRVALRRGSRWRPRRVRAVRRGRGPALARRAARRGARRDPALLSGERVDHQGEHFTVDGRHARAGARSASRSGSAGMSAKARARAARFDGWFADTASPSEMTTTPGEFAAMLEGYYLRRRRGDGLLRTPATRAARRVRRRWCDLVDRADPRRPRRRGRVLARVDAGP